MSEELKPCPFCGGEARMNVAFASGGDHSVGVYVVCLECRSWSGTKWGDGAQEKAAEAWNRRANDCDRDELLALADEIDADAENIAGYLDSCEGNFSKSDADEYYKFARWVNRIREACGEVGR